MPFAIKEAGFGLGILLVLVVTAITGRTPVEINCRFGPLPVPLRPLFGRHLEQRIFNDHRNK